MSSQDAHAAIDQKLAAKFEELYASRGNPTTLDDAFVKEYFSVLDNFNVPDNEVEDTEFSGDKTLGPHKTNAHLGSSTGSLLRVVIPKKGRELFVKDGVDAVVLNGTSQTTGHASGTYTYTLENIKGNIVRITMKKKGSPKRVDYISTTTQKVTIESGVGKWQDTD